jgi:hypothetical protein
LNLLPPELSLIPVGLQIVEQSLFGSVQAHAANLRAAGFKTTAKTPIASQIRYSSIAITLQFSLGCRIVRLLYKHAPRPRKNRTPSSYVAKT